MRFPALTDTIIAVATGWQPASVGVVRLSGANSFTIVNKLLDVAPAATGNTRPHCTAARLSIDAHTTLPAQVCWFHAPRSYTGQNVVELHLSGCLPLLRLVCDRCIVAGARRALPGEFTARALRNGKLTAQQAAGILQLMESSRADQLRHAARQTRGHAARELADLRTNIETLLARIEAGIDFVEEEDVRFVEVAEARQALHDFAQALARLADADTTLPSLACSHVALVGIPNAGKSTLFNALVDTRRVLVSPVVGTTRDVISAELNLAGQPAVLQDCPGLGAQRDALELATHCASERAADQADLILWVHPIDEPWYENEVQACRNVAPDRLILVYNKVDLHPAVAPPVPISGVPLVHISAATGAGLNDLRRLIQQHIADLTPTARDPLGYQLDWSAARAALACAAELLPQSATRIELPELLALELREALSVLAPDHHADLDELLLDQIFARFCVGK